MKKITIIATFALLFGLIGCAKQNNQAVNYPVAADQGQQEQEYRPSKFGKFGAENNRKDTMK